MDQVSFNFPMQIQINLVSAVLEHLNVRYATEIEKSSAFRMLKERYEHLLETQQKQLSRKANATSFIPAYREALLDLIEVKRKALLEEIHRAVYVE